MFAIADAGDGVVEILNLLIDLFSGLGGLSRKSLNSVGNLDGKSLVLILEELAEKMRNEYKKRISFVSAISNGGVQSIVGVVHGSGSSLSHSGSAG